MGTGIMAGVLWGINTIVLGIALAMTPFTSTEQAIFLAPFVSTFLHDFFSAIWMVIYMGIRKQCRQVIRALRTKSGRFIMLGALLGGPIGMSGYVAAIKYIGPSYTAIISAMFPAVGAFFSYLFLREKLLVRQIIGMAVSILGVILLGYAPNEVTGSNDIRGFACALLCCVGWAAEAVICAYGMKDTHISDEHALIIRQMTSAIFYAVIILPLLNGWRIVTKIILTQATEIIVLGALFGTASYLCYYRAISRIGATKAMVLNITYSAWAIVFSMILWGTFPDVKSIVSMVMIIGGSTVAAADYKNLGKI